MKIPIEDIELGHSPLTDEIHAGKKNKAKDKWIEKKNVTNDFIGCVIGRWENQKEIISFGDQQWEVSVKKIKN